MLNQQQQNLSVADKFFIAYSDQKLIVFECLKCRQHMVLKTELSIHAIAQKRAAHVCGKREAA